MRPRRAFRPTGDALEARWVLSSVGAHHAIAPAHAHVHRVHHALVATGFTSGNVALVNLFPFATGTTIFQTNASGIARTTLISNVPSPAIFGTSSTILSQIGSTAVVNTFGSSTTPGFVGAGGDLNGLVLFGGPVGTPGGDINGLVVF